MNWHIQGGRVLTDRRLATGDLSVTGGNLTEVRAAHAPVIDADGLLVLPGIVDIHGDGFERQIMPRTGVRFDTALALKDTDRQLVGNGVTTAFHGVTVSWEPGLRSLEAAERLIGVLCDIRDTLACDTRLHLRWETFALDQMAQVIKWLSLVPRPIIALNDHTTGSVLKGASARKIGQMAERSSLSREEYMTLLDRVWSRRDNVAIAIETLAATARANGNVLLAHDEASPEERAHFRALGAKASEFPLTIETAKAARQMGEDVILGAPNVVRGGSHNGALDATDAVRAGLCTVLTSDYHYPSPLHAAFRLSSPGASDFPSIWDLVSANPARVAGFADRGSLVAGRRADLILVDAQDPAHPHVVATMVHGRIVYSSGLLQRRLPVSTPIAAE
ncbi:alpha-D-ribose 1-methylphosphonate 5-triphosphate diphosphatase [Mesorhizobium shangrilense]|uniref:Alpha-D-ribose 1-methylphosphonate 5-triphosphate diphosphatase n=1 Tax=Mesorhizobium shangrilense TaxID=460060 RepID=A0ABV2DLV5_9HYPH